MADESIAGHRHLLPQLLRSKHLATPSTYLAAHNNTKAASISTVPYTCAPFKLGSRTLLRSCIATATLSLSPPRSHGKTGASWAIRIAKDNIAPRQHARTLCNIRSATFSSGQLHTEFEMDETAPSPSPGVPAAHRSSPAPTTAGSKRKRGTGNKFYAVKAGFQPGIYTEWKECLAQITGYKGAICE